MIGGLTIARAVTALTAFALLALLSELILPLRSVSHEKWEWELRPSKRFPRIGWFGWSQVFIFAVAVPVLGGMFRLLIGVIPLRRLPTVLANGVTQAMTRTSLMFFDSERAADTYAAAWLLKMKVRARPLRGPVVPALMLRRVSRRGYVPLLFLITALLGFSVVPYFGLVGRGTLVLTWAVLASGVWRATSLGIPGQWRWQLLILGVVTALGVGVQWLPGIPAHVFEVALCTVVAVVYCAIVRGRPRENSFFLSVDAGFGVPLPVGMLSYWFSGGLAVVPAVLAAVLAAH